MDSSPPSNAFPENDRTPWRSGSAPDKQRAAMNDPFSTEKKTPNHRDESRTPGCSLPWHTECQQHTERQRQCHTECQRQCHTEPLPPLPAGSSWPRPKDPPQAPFRRSSAVQRLLPRKAAKQSLLPRPRRARGPSVPVSAPRRRQRRPLPDALLLHLLHLLGAGDHPVDDFLLLIRQLLALALPLGRCCPSCREPAGTAGTGIRPWVVPTPACAQAPLPKSQTHPSSPSSRSHPARSEPPPTAGSSELHFLGGFMWKCWFHTEGKLLFRNIPVISTFPLAPWSTRSAWQPRDRGGGAGVGGFFLGTFRQAWECFFCL